MIRSTATACIAMTIVLIPRVSMAYDSNGTLEVEACGRRAYAVPVWAEGTRVSMLLPSASLGVNAQCKTVELFAPGSFEGTQAKVTGPSSLRDLSWIEADLPDLSQFSTLNDILPVPIGVGQPVTRAAEGSDGVLGLPWLNEHGYLVAIETPEPLSVPSSLLPVALEGPVGAELLLLVPPNLCEPILALAEEGDVACMEGVLKAENSRDRVLEGRRLAAVAGAHRLGQIEQVSDQSLQVSWVSDRRELQNAGARRSQSQLFDNSVWANSVLLEGASLEDALALVLRWNAIQKALTQKDDVRLYQGLSLQLEQLEKSLQAANKSLEPVLNEWRLPILWQLGQLSDALAPIPGSHDWAVWQMALGYFGAPVGEAIEGSLAMPSQEQGKVDRAALHRSHGQYLLHLGHLEQAQSAFSSALAQIDPLSQWARWYELKLDLLDVTVAMTQGEARKIKGVLKDYEAILGELDGREDRLLVARAKHGMARASSLLPFESEGLLIEQAIALSLEALQELDATRQPMDYADLHDTLGYLYQVRSIGDWYGRMDDALASYQRALDIYDQDLHGRKWAWTMVNLGTAWLNRVGGNAEENMRRAQAAYDEAQNVAETLGDVQLLATIANNRGQAYLFNGDTLTVQQSKKAVGAFTRASKLLENTADEKAKALTQANQEIARYYYKSAKAQLNGPDSGRGAEALGDAYLVEGLHYREWILLTQGVDRFDQAEQQFLKAIKTVPEAGLFYHKLAVVRWKKGDLPGALTAQEKAMQLEPDSLYIANWHRFLSAQRMLILDPNSAQAHMMLGQVNLELGDAHTALEDYARAAKADRTQAAPWVEMTRVHMSLEDYTAAQQAIYKAASIEADDFDVRAIAFAIAHEFTYDFKGAHAHAKRMRDLDHESVAAIDISYVQTLLTSGQSIQMPVELRQLLGREDLSEEEHLVLSALAWLQRIDGGQRTRRAWSDLLESYSQVREGTQMTWGWTGVKHYIDTALDPSTAETVIGIITMLEADASASILQELEGVKP